eukprot:TRINITY_DN1000_c0_g1_i4.p1 TRINITY_DN1000_c0_g1~~TRINITY_DN1000_c0_g1_i4.p1  ORF type:complete len:112 (-),score=14.32 TRINITY_DN1000_c0_g1_i4:516-851(-)
MYGQNGVDWSPLKILMLDGFLQSHNLEIQVKSTNFVLMGIVTSFFSNYYPPTMISREDIEDYNMESNVNDELAGMVYLIEGINAGAPSMHHRSVVIDMKGKSNETRLFGFR